MNENSKIGVIGGGSWATSIVKMLCENVNSVNWWMRNKDAISHIETYGHNPNYISDADLKKSKLCLSSNINTVVENSDYLVLAVPSVFLKYTLNNLPDSICLGSIIRDDKIIIPNQKTNIKENDKLLIFLKPEYISKVENIFQ